MTSDLPQDQFVCKSVRNWRAIEGWDNKSCFRVREQVCEFGSRTVVPAETLIELI